MTFTAIRSAVFAFLRDVRYAARGLRRAPGFTLVATVTLGLGIGANSAIFTVVNAVMLKGLPYRSADLLVHVWETEPRQAARQVSYPDFTDIRDGATSLGAVAGYAFGAFTLKSEGGSERLAAGRVSATFFRCSASNRFSAACSAQRRIDRSEGRTSRSSPTGSGNVASAVTQGSLAEGSHSTTSL